VTEHRFYGELATWWPLISPVEEYEEEATFAAKVLREQGRAAPRTVLELGSGGGHNAWYLKRSFTLTLVDLAEEMLDVSRAINPECEHIAGDMRTVRLGRTFDAVFVHDAIAYMLTEDDLRRALQTAYEHTAPGGHAVFVPDDLRETWQPWTDHGGVDAPGAAKGARYLAWHWTPDPAETITRVEFAFLLRDGDQVTSTHETHLNGLFAAADWRRQLTAVGFEAHAVTEETTEDRAPRTFFVGLKPS
jgi:SAM-dependent methyltransferase